MDRARITPRIIQCARGDSPADLVLANARIINVFTGEIVRGNLAIAEGHIIGMGDYASRQRIDLKGRFLCPGFIDAHVHIESSMTAIPGFVRAVLPCGVTTVVADPHEIANVMGAGGIRYMMAAGEHQPMNLYFTLPSCVPATDMETAGADLTADAILPFFQEDRVLALGEMMNYPGVLAGVPEVLRKIDAARKHRKPVDGHSPGLSEHELNAYLSAGISSDHECTTAKEAAEKLAAGMYIMIREATGAKNLNDLLPVVTERNHHRILWCTDDRHPHDLLAEGSIDFILRRAISAGLDPILAIRMATLNPAQYFGLHHLGAIAPGRQADLVVFSDLTDPHVEMVYTHGILRVEEGHMLAEETTGTETAPPPSPMTIPMDRIDLSVSAGGDRIRVIEMIPDQIITRHAVTEPTVSNGRVVADVSRDLLKIAVVERYTGRGGVGIGFVRGFNLKRGAIASSVAHDSHNLIVVGADDTDMMAALQRLIDAGGGLAAVSGAGGADATAKQLPLPIAGLMSRSPMEVVRSALDEVIGAAHGMGCTLPDPFMALSFLALPVIPSLKITDRGLVDVDRFQPVDLFVD